MIKAPQHRSTLRHAGASLRQACDAALRIAATATPRMVYSGTG
jgi:hypothetical protein